MQKMPDRITDGPADPGDEFAHMPADDRTLWEAMDEEMQRRLDAGLCRWCGVHAVPDWGEMCHQCKVEAAEMREFR